MAVSVGDLVVAGAAEHRVVAFVAFDGVVAFVAGEIIIAGAAFDQIVTRAAVHGAGQSEFGRVLRCAADFHASQEMIVALPAEQGFVGRAGEDRVASRAPGEQVMAIPATGDAVVAIAAENGRRNRRDAQDDVVVAAGSIDEDRVNLRCVEALFLAVDGDEDFVSAAFH